VSVAALSGITCGIATDVLPRRYSSPSLVARGGMGEVYRATDSVLERTVAVKVLSERHSREPEVRARFTREALTAARLSGTSNVITVFDVGEHDKRPFIVMEYLHGGSVYDRIREGRVPPAQALEWLAQAGQALDRAHENGVVHRDVKPANLLLDRDGNLQVSDFGIASTTGFDTLTLPGTVLGTAGYLSPEQARGEPATPASDRYALGVVAFELLTGQRPFQGDTAATEAFAHVNAPVPSAQRLEPGLPTGVDTVLARALAKDPRDRPRSSAELVADLRKAFASGASPTLVETGTPTRRIVHRTRRSARALLVLGVAALLLAGLVLAALLGVILDEGSGGRAATRAGTDGSTTTTQQTTTQQTIEQPPSVDGVALNDAGFNLMKRRDFQGALPLLEQAVDALSGSGTKTEAWASYNLANTRFALGSCGGVLALLDRSESIQGQRKPIDRLRRQAEKTCLGGTGGGHGRKNDEEGD
jgi:tRNA A-37 threonylcarbamoyl transferase component Bud32